MVIFSEFFFLINNFCQIGLKTN